MKHHTKNSIHKAPKVTHYEKWPDCIYSVAGL